jgi:predicted metal-dependent RNase
MCPLFFEAASSTPICCITNTTKPIFIIEKDYSSLSTQRRNKATFAEKLVH